MKLYQSRSEGGKVLRRSCHGIMTKHMCFHCFKYTSGSHGKRKNGASDLQRAPSASAGVAALLYCSYACEQNRDSPLPSRLSGFCLPPVPVQNVFQRFANSGLECGSQRISDGYEPYLHNLLVGNVQHVRRLLLKVEMESGQDGA